MKLALVQHLHGAVALDRSRTPIRVVAEGTGRLVVGDVACWVRGGVDRVFLVKAQDVVVVRCRGLTGGDRTILRLVTFEPPVDPRPRVPPLGVAAAVPHLHVAAPSITARAIRPDLRLRGDPP